MSEAKHTLTDVTVEENSLVDRPANQRTFLVRKRSAADGDGYLNPILKDDLEQERATKEAVATATTAPETTSEATATKAATAEVVPAPSTESEKDMKKEEATPPTPAAETPTPVVEAVKSDKPVEDKTIKSEGEYEEKVLIQPALKGALEAGLRSIGELADRALKTLGQAQGDVGGISWTPWDIRCLIQQIDDLADRMIGDYEGNSFGGSAWIADAILAGGAVDGVSKAGAAMASARLKRFSSAHGDMGSAFKGLKKAYDAMGSLLKEVSGKDDDKAEKAAEPAPTTVVVVPDLVTPPAPVVKADKDMSEASDLRKEVTELRKALASQAAVIEKARIPQPSNVIPVEKSDRGNDTMNRDVVWPADMGASNRSRPGGF